MENDTSAVVSFHAGTGRDDRGRTLVEILAWDDDRLERVHDYIQWLFPLPERSAFNPAAPVLTDADIEAFRSRADLRTALRRALFRLLAFYGFEEQRETIVPAPGLPVRSRNWLTPGNHNLLRISRILRSLTLLGLEPEALAFLAVLEGLPEDRRATIGPVTFGYWRRAVAPDA
jgi:hypothetical protein